MNKECRCKKKKNAFRDRGSTCRSKCKGTGLRNPTSLRWLLGGLVQGTRGFALIRPLRSSGCSSLAFTREAQTIISSPSSLPHPISLQILSVLPLKPLRIQALLQPRGPQTSLFGTIHHLSHRMASEPVLPSLLWPPFTPLSNLLLKGSFYNVNPAIMTFQILGWLAAQHPFGSSPDS